MLLTCVLLAGMLLFLFFHPYTFYPLSLGLFPERPVQIAAQAQVPTATFVFSAYNEERSLPAKIDNLRAIRALYPDGQIIAYSDCSSDRTLALLEQNRDLLHVIGGTARAGKATGMRMMVAQASGDIVIFTDANVILDPRSIAPLLRYFTDPSVGGVAGTLKYINEDASSTAKVGGLYWRLEELIKRRESRTGSIMGADGSIFATRRSLYPEVPAHLLDDMVTSMTVTFHGLRLIHAADVIAYEKNATSSSEEFRRKRRIACRAFNTHRYLWPCIRRHYRPIDIYKYVSHKLIRWLGLPTLVLGLAMLFVALLVAHYTLAAIALAAGLVLFILLGMAGLPPFHNGYQIVLSIIATFYGVIDSLRGKTYQTWAPAASRD
jgi:cellulose synthase/poly-beta-1,6-N-acetylglucosamine synthase-like glycosyltransferase